MTTAEPPRPEIFVVDDDESVRTAIGRLLASANLECELFAGPRDFLRRADDDLSGCVLLDVRMPDMNGFEVQQVLRERGHDIPIIFLTAYADVPLTVRAMKGGAVEVLTKPFEEDTLLGAVSAALEVACARRADHEELRECRARYQTLTRREREVMALVASGMLNKEAADRLGTAEKTVKVQRARAMRKMSARSFADLVRMVDRLNSVRPDTQRA